MLNPIHMKKTRLAAMLLGCFAAQHALAIDTYVGDPGTLGDPASWRTDEFKSDWGLAALGAEFAYARGFSGKGVKVGLVDSGYFNLHPELNSSRYHGVEVNGIAGAWNGTYNDTHGTHVSGTVGAARDGLATTGNMHGVAFNADLYIGNTHKTDGVLYGLPQATQTVAHTIENAYVGDVYRTVNAQGVRIIGTSFGSQPNTEQYQTLFASANIPGAPTLTGRVGLYGAWSYLSGQDTWFQGTLDAAKTGTIIAFSAGNGGYANPSPRAAAAYFMPELEENWLAVAAIRQNLTIGGVAVGQTLNADGSVNVPGAQLYNQCGLAKWSCVTAPGNTINSSRVTVVNGVPTPTYGNSSGTSMAQPHATGALAVIMERFSYMTNAQALDVMKTTAVQNGTINSADNNMVAIANPNAGKMVEVPDERNGWGTVSLKNAMNGPGQFTGKFAVNTQGQSDVWSNNISDTAIKARKIEDTAEAATWNATKASKGWTNGFVSNGGIDDQTEYTTGMAREAARNSRVYEGSLSKDGAGTLVLSGNNSYSGGTEIFGGTLVGRSATAFGSGDMTVHAGQLAGTTTIAGDLLKKGGIVSPGEGIGTLTVLGNFAQFPAGTLDMEWSGGLTDLLDVKGTAFLGGTLGVTFLDAYTGTGHTLYTLVSTGNYLGTFSMLDIAGLGAGYTASLVYTSFGVQLDVSAVPEPETYALMLAGLGVMGWVARRRQQKV
ncbi:hypothetical protein BH11PSE9_BH11PSE9_06560 [soil metagenome]